MKAHSITTLFVIGLALGACKRSTTSVVKDDEAPATDPAASGAVGTGPATSDSLGDAQCADPGASLRLDDVAPTPTTRSVALGRIAGGLQHGLDIYNHIHDALADSTYQTQLDQARTSLAATQSASSACFGALSCGFSVRSGVAPGLQAACANFRDKLNAVADNEAALLSAVSLAGVDSRLGGAGIEIFLSFTPPPVETVLGLVSGLLTRLGFDPNIDWAGASQLEKSATAARFPTEMPRDVFRRMMTNVAASVQDAIAAAAPVVAAASNTYELAVTMNGPSVFDDTYATPRVVTYQYDSNDTIAPLVNPTSRETELAIAKAALIDAYGRQFPTPSTNLPLNLDSDNVRYTLTLIAGGQRTVLSSRDSTGTTP